MGSNPESLRFYSPEVQAGGIKSTAVLRKLRRVLPERYRGQRLQVDSLASLDDPIIGGSGTNATKDGIESSRADMLEEPERTHRVEREWSIRRVRKEDIPFIAQWFKDPKVRAHVFDEHVNPYIPEHWNNPDEVARFEYALRDFLIPNGPISIETKIPHVEGQPMPKDRVLHGVNRITKVALTIEEDEDGTKRQIPVAVQCWLDNDPYAPQEDRDRIDSGELRVAYGHFMVVDNNPKYQNKGMALYLTTARADELLGKSPESPGIFDQISTLVNITGDTGDRSWAEVVNFFVKFGYDVDRRPEGKAVGVLGEAGKTPMWRMLQTRTDYWRNRQKAINGLREKDIKFDKGY